VKVQAVVLNALNQPVHVEELDLAPPADGEILVRVAYAGVCHTDLHAITGVLPVRLPVVLGHEGSGVVEATGPHVDSLKVGDHVILLWKTPCNHCRFCSVGRFYLCDESYKSGVSGPMPDGTYRFFRGDQPINYFDLNSCMSEYTVMKEPGVIPIPRDVPLDIAAVLGCAVLTGVGAVIHTSEFQPGSTVAVFGAGGVGLSSIMGAAMAGAAQIIAIDIEPRKLAYAREMGATDVVDVRLGDAVETVRELTGGKGVDYAFEAIGMPSAIEQAFLATRRGGITVVIGIAPADARASISPRILVSEERTLRGCFYGSSRPHDDIPRLLHLYRAGRLPLEKLISARFPITQAMDAFQALESGGVARAVINMGSS
jgi:S-(hydroxymethyl)glutathione dehydrogenase/alcohol dehydrogenase